MIICLIKYHKNDETGKISHLICQEFMEQLKFLLIIFQKIKLIKSENNDMALQMTENCSVRYTIYHILSLF